MNYCKRFLESVLRRRKFALSSLYLYFSISVIFIAALFSIVFVIMEFNDYENARNTYLQQQIHKLDLELYEKINVAENMLSMLAEKLHSSNNFSHENIAFLIKHQRSSFKKDVFTWTLIDFVDQEYNIIIDSIFGIRRQPIHLDPNRRAWLHEARDFPWEIKFGKPDYGMISKQKIISTGYGITNQDDKFMGYLSAAIYLNKINNFLSLVVDKDTSYILADHDLNFILSSHNQIEESAFKAPADLAKIISEDKAINVPHMLKNPIKIDNFLFSQVLQNEHYPFVLLVGQNRIAYYQYFKEEVIPHIIRNIAFSVGFVCILLILSYIIVSPTVELGKIAIAISKGEPVNIPKYKALELDILAAQLSKIQNVTKDLRYKQTQLTKANNDLKLANEFIQSNMSFLSHELKNPNHSIIGFSQLMKKKLNAENADSELKEFADYIHQVAVHQDKQINFFLKLFQFQEKAKIIECKKLNLDELIKINVNMSLHHANKKKVKVKIEIAPDLPVMLGDEIMIGQMIQNFVSNGAKYNKKNGDLIIRAFTRVHNRKQELIMQFQDTGIGIEEKDVQKLFKKFERIKNDKNSGTLGYGLGLAFAKNCIVAHDGEIFIKSQPNVGTIFTIVFPRSRIHTGSISDASETQEINDNISLAA